MVTVTMGRQNRFTDTTFIISDSFDPFFYTKGQVVFLWGITSDNRYKVISRICHKNTRDKDLVITGGFNNLSFMEDNNASFWKRTVLDKPTICTKLQFFIHKTNRKLNYFYNRNIGHTNITGQ